MTNGKMVRGKFWKIATNKTIQCLLCPHYCLIEEGEVGKCKVRSNIEGQLIADSYGLVSAVALDPIEKKPLKLYKQGNNILSIGSFGCNMNCSFCQNHGISLEYEERLKYGKNIYPSQLATLARKAMLENNIGVAYTYNEPFVGYEYVLDCAKIINSMALDNVIVTNGFINPIPLKMLLPYINAMNIDLKCFSSNYYKALGGQLDKVKDVIEIVANKPHIHLEITTLIIPEDNDCENEINEMAKWIASINPNTPLHLSRFFPVYKYCHGKPTPIDLLHRLKEIATRHLNNVFIGNVPTGQ